MISPGHSIVVGVSGGADSVCLLFVLLEYAKRVPVKLAAAHINHGIRPDAEEDASFVEKLCLREGIPFFLRQADVKGFAANEKCSEEEAGRQLRYRAFREIAAHLSADRIAVAHNGNDLAETTVFHLFRGSGLKGLCGIPPVREEIIRPLLCLQRGEIEEYLRERRIPCRTDSTNLSDDYTRNRIRHYVLPYAEEQVSAGAVAHICRTAETLSEVEEYLEQQTKEAMAHCVEVQSYGGMNHEKQQLKEAMAHCVEVQKVDKHPYETADKSDEYASVRFRVDAERFGKLHVAIRKRLLLKLIKILAPGHRDIAAVHVDEALALFQREGNARIDLPFDIIAERSYKEVLLWRDADETEEAACVLPDKPIRVKLPPGETMDPLIYEIEGLGQIEFSIFFLNEGQKVPQNPYTKWFDCDKIMEPPVLRFRRTGDFLSIADGHGGAVRKMLKSYMITEKIPRRNRDTVLLLAEGSHVLWLVGYRISEYYKIKENTKRVLQVKLLASCLDSGTEEKDGGTHQGTFA